ncbi:GntR family transcriptional regulator [Pseudonocardia spinosispora]|uniref:GntR family transcriptional regulator n=1 Tax=Pseudonocardia spinosispora TaxID=103441 RepID=UPI00041B620A|nr:GntR family transcriptional regulator [Pseudonocardia spinosispora]
MSASARLYSLESLHALRGFVDQTAEAINAGRLRTGESIDLNQIADELHIAPHNVRRALEPLTNEGLLSFSEPHRVVVAPPDPRELDRVYELRRLIQPGLLVAAIPEAPLVGLDAVGAVTEGFTVVDWQADGTYSTIMDFFYALVKPYNSPAEFTLISELELKSERSLRIGFDELKLRYPTDMQTLSTQYLELLDACRMRSADAVRDAELGYLELSQDISMMTIPSAHVISL